MKIWFDTEFIEDGKTIDLLSIGMVREDGATLYFESADCDLSRASPWVKENVLPHLRQVWTGRRVIASALSEFAGDKPEFWADYAAYDWVALCQLFGTMMDLPKGWPMYCNDVQQLRMHAMNAEPPVPPSATAHNALADALECKAKYEWLWEHRD